VTGRPPLARRLVLAAAAVVVAAAPCTRAVAQSRPDSGGTAAVLSVPYLPQSEDLCGGAAAAMVMRYWGARNVYPQAFASLVDHSAGGIRTGALVSALAARGWTAMAESGTRGRIREQLALGRPVVALIAVARNRYHYVVVLGLTARGVVLHDPARAPDTVMPDSRFDRAWSATDRWMMTLLPPANLDTRAPAHDVFAPPPPASCASLVEQGVAAAGTEGSRADARALLRQAAAECPRSSAPWRELAGVDVLDEDWQSSERNASEAVRLDPRDHYAWQVLATVRFLSGHDAQALEAWNHAGEPIVDLVNVTGLERTRYGVVSGAASIAPGEILTPGSLQRADRRVADVPSIATARVRYDPIGGGRAQVDVAVVERDLYPRGVPAVAAIGVGAAANRTIDASLSSLTGGGERIDASWRWWAHRPAISAAFVAPAPLLGGTWEVDASRQTETFLAASRQTRTHVGAAAHAWITARFRVGGQAGIDRWLDRERQAMGAVDVELWPIRDRLTLAGRVAHWAGGDAFSTARLDALFTSQPDRAANLWVVRGNIAAAGAAAPALAWPGADTGHVRDVLLRAHPLLDGDSIGAGVFGRRLVSGGVEYQHWSRPSKWLLQYAPAAFVDVARATRGMQGSITAAQIDAGLGLRVAAPGSGILRIDLAHGLRDGRTALSVMWQR
jgi:hypothetical protein